MDSKLVRVIIIFLAISVVAFVSTRFLGIHFGTNDFWDYHGVLFLIAITFFPRLTLLFSSVPFGGIFWWLGWLFAPRILVAILATITYWNSNPILVTLSWLIAIGLESSEKRFVIYRTRRVRTDGADRQRDVGPSSEIIDVTPTHKE